ncbi:hypothetical protein BD410DRAFT_764711 [Rickenella mellea]|uniref:BTB domain-containing protein n=1 Tax=Rickenella mellea TaxID=50990 RepID=A0A4Y7QFP9_9AGAM|nr:hypothetical protein BD410DRAFT_764711 [Rickenella mellea]
MSTNPSHILIARNSRSLNNPAATLSSPTETHAAASGVFRSSGTPQWLLEECEADDDVVSDLVSDDSEGVDIELEDAFTRHARFPGTVKIVVETTTFWAHREILVFASPFFEAALSGHWSETSRAKTANGRPQSMSSVITISQPPSVPGEKGSTPAARDSAPEMTFAPIDPDINPEELEVDVEVADAKSGFDFDTISAGSCSLDGESSASASESESDSKGHKERERHRSLDKLQGGSSRLSSQSEDVEEKEKADKPSGLSCFHNHSNHPTQAHVKRSRKPNTPDAVIVLKEEKASTFHDFLRFVYPHLECTTTWNNVEGLMNISHKLCVPALQRQCLTFLLTHAAGKPIKAMRIAELFGEEELYRESSRFVLDNPGGWSEAELGTLSQQTLLKLEKRRNWFLERVLKLGLINIAKEYQCSSTCPDPPNCARILDERWRHAYGACFRFGPCQPSMVYRYLRGLEGVTPPLSLTHLSCQATAKAFTATLFDRMFALGVRGSGTDATPLGARVSGASPGPRRHFLYCSLKV